MIALSCGINISTVHHLELSQSTRVSDRQTDGQMDKITTPQTAVAYARAVISAGCLVQINFSLKPKFGHKLSFELEFEQKSSIFN